MELSYIEGVVLSESIMCGRLSINQYEANVGPQTMDMEQGDFMATRVENRFNF